LSKRWVPSLAHVNDETLFVAACVDQRSNNFYPCRSFRLQHQCGALLLISEGCTTGRPDHFAATKLLTGWSASVFPRNDASRDFATSTTKKVVVAGMKARCTTRVKAVRVWVETSPIRTSDFIGMGIDVLLPFFAEVGKHRLAVGSALWCCSMIRTHCHLLARYN
jgi:hypothetical protein